MSAAGQFTRARPRTVPSNDIFMTSLLECDYGPGALSAPPPVPVQNKAAGTPQPPRARCIKDLGGEDGGLKLEDGTNREAPWTAVASGAQHRFHNSMFAFDVGCFLLSPGVLRVWPVGAFPAKTRGQPRLNLFFTDCRPVFPRAASLSGPGIPRPRWLRRPWHAAGQSTAGRRWD